MRSLIRIARVKRETSRRFLRLREIDGGWILRVGRFEIIYGGRFFDLVKPPLVDTYCSGPRRCCPFNEAS
jgi:hypothetical protein